MFLTNTEGIFDRPPDQPGAQLLQEILVSPDGSWRVAEEGVSPDGQGVPPDGSWREAGDGVSPGGRREVRLECGAHDVSGGVETKVREAAAIAALGMDVIIAEAGSAAGEAACVEGPEAFRGPQPRHRGTLVRLERCNDGA